MKKLKLRIIRWLGGYTNKDLEREFDFGYVSAFHVIKQHADELYGKSPKEWCKNMYEYLEKAER